MFQKIYFLREKEKDVPSILISKEKYIFSKTKTSLQNKNGKKFYCLTRAIATWW